MRTKPTRGSYQLKMSGGAMYAVQTVVRGYHHYKEVWIATAGQILPCQQECGNVHDPYPVAIGSNAVGHVPRAIQSHSRPVSTEQAVTTRRLQYEQTTHKLWPYARVRFPQRCPDALPVKNYFRGRRRYREIRERFHSRKFPAIRYIWLTRSTYSDTLSCNLQESDICLDCSHTVS